MNKLPTRTVPAYYYEASDRYILVYGHLGVGFEFVGPFESYDDAWSWQKRTHSEHSSQIQMLHQQVATTVEQKYNPDLEEA